MESMQADRLSLHARRLGEIAAAATGAPSALLEGRDLDALVEVSLAKAITELSSRFGSRERWRWGPLHRTSCVIRSTT